MSVKSVYLPRPAISGGILQIKDEEHRHLTVARTEPGELVDVFDDRGHVWSCEVIKLARHETSAHIVREYDVPPPAFEVTLALAVIQRSAFELALEKCVEVGVTRIAPFVASRSNVRLREKPERWERIIVEAAKQSKRFHLPSINVPVKFEDVLRIPAASRILFAEHGGGPLKSALAGPPLLYLVGPEGGWTDDEVKSAEAAGFRPVSLGAGVLRSETAAIVGAALIRYELGEITFES